MPQNYNFFHTTIASSFLQNKSHLISEKLASPVIKGAIYSSRKWERGVSPWPPSLLGISKIKKLCESCKMQFKKTLLSLSGLELVTVVKRENKCLSTEVLLGKLHSVPKFYSNIYITKRLDISNFIAIITIRNQVISFLPVAGTFHTELSPHVTRSFFILPFLSSTWVFPGLWAMNFPSATFSPN